MDDPGAFLCGIACGLSILASLTIPAIGLVVVALDSALTVVLTGVRAHRLHEDKCAYHI